MNFHPDVLAAHAQFGGDLESMQKLYEYPGLVSRIEQLERHAEDTGTLLRNSVKRISELERELASARSEARKLRDDFEEMGDKFLQAKFDAAKARKAALEEAAIWIEPQRNDVPMTGQEAAAAIRSLAEQEGT